MEKMCTRGEDKLNEHDKKKIILYVKCNNDNKLAATNN